MYVDHELIISQKVETEDTQEKQEILPYKEEQEKE